MKAAPAPMVLTAGVGRNIKAAKTNKNKGKQARADEETGTSELSVTNTQGVSLEAQNYAAAAALYTNGEGNKGVVPVDSG